MQASKLWLCGSRERSAELCLALIWLVLGIAMVAVAVWLGWTRWPAILNGHPAMLITGIGGGLFGFIAIAWSIGSLTIGDRQDREGDPEHPRRRTSEEVLRRAHWRIVFAVPLLVLAFLLVLSLAYARPFVATPAAIAALRSENGVRIADRPTWYELIPVREDPSGENDQADDCPDVHTRCSYRLPRLCPRPSPSGGSRLPGRGAEGAVRLLTA